MKVENAKMVSVHYTLTVDGQVADQSREGQPLQFICGTGMLLPKFEGAIIGKEPGEKVSFTLASARQNDPPTGDISPCRNPLPPGQRPSPGGCSPS